MVGVLCSVLVPVLADCGCCCLLLKCVADGLLFAGDVVCCCSLLGVAVHCCLCVLLLSVAFRSRWLPCVFCRF